MTTMRKINKSICCILALLLSTCIFSACDRHADTFSESEEELAVTRVTIDKIIQTTALEEGDAFQMMIYSTGPVNSSVLYATVDAAVESGGTISLSSYYPHLVKTGDTGIRSDLYLPSGNYRWFAYMTPQGVDQPVANIQTRELTFTRDMDLMVAINDVTIAYDDTQLVNQQEKIIDWVHPFYHQSSQVVFKIEHKEPTATEIQGKDNINLKEIVLSNIYGEGVCTMPLTDNLNSGTSICTVSPSASAQKTATVTLEADEDPESAAKFTDNGTPAVTTYPFLLVPSDNAAGMRIKVKLQCDFLLESSDVTITAITQEQFAFEPGKKYTFTLKIDKERPLLYCTVTDWDIETGNKPAEIDDDGLLVGGENMFVVESWKPSGNQANDVGEGENI